MRLIIVFCLLFSSIVDAGSKKSKKSTKRLFREFSRDIARNINGVDNRFHVKDLRLRSDTKTHWENQRRASSLAPESKSFERDPDQISDW